MTKSDDAPKYKYFRGKAYEVFEPTDEEIEKHKAEDVAWQASPIGMACTRITMAVRELVAVYWAEEGGPPPYDIGDDDLPERLAEAVTNGLEEHLDRDPDDVISQAIRVSTKIVPEDTGP